MADAYGKMIVLCEFTGDRTTVLNALNRYSWNSDNEPFALENDGYIFMDGLVQYPEIFPACKLVYDENGNEVDINAPDFNGVINDDWDVQCGEEVDLEEIVKAIGPLLGEGHLTISMTSSKKTFETNAGELIIRSNMTGTQRFRSFATDGYNRDVTYHYP
jgi:hypothetical protein